MDYSEYILILVSGKKISIKFSAVRRQRSRWLDCDGYPDHDWNARFL